MRKLLSIIIAIAAVRAAASPTATQAWVSNYVDKTAMKYEVKTSTTNGVGGVQYDVYKSWNLTMLVEKPTVSALMATNATALATAQNVTNGMFFVWRETEHSYTNHANAIMATTSNLVWNAIQSKGGSFSNYFDVVSVKIQPTYAKEVTK